MMHQEVSMRKTVEKRFVSVLIIGETRNAKSFLTCMIWKKNKIPWQEKPEVNQTNSGFKRIESMKQYCFWMAKHRQYTPTIPAKTCSCSKETTPLLLFEQAAKLNLVTRFLPQSGYTICCDFKKWSSGQKNTSCGCQSQEPQDVLAEKERFELSNPFTGYTISSRAPSTKLGDFSRTLSGPGISIALSFPPVKVCPNVFMPPRSHELCLSRLRCFPCPSGRSPPRRASCPRCIGPPLPARSCPASHSPL